MKWRDSCDWIIIAINKILFNNASGWNKYIKALW